MFILGIISSVCKNNLLKTASPDFYDMFYKRGFPLAWKKSNVVSLHKKESKLWKYHQTGLALLSWFAY